MIPVEVSESVAIVKVPRYAEHSVESRLEYSDMRRHKHEVKFEPTLAPVRFADTMIVYGKNNTRKRYVSRTFYEPRVKPKRFADTDFVFPKDKQQRFASFVDYHIDECRKWFKTCLELKAKTFTTVHSVPGHETTTRSVTSSGDVNGVRRDVTLAEGPGASQVFIPPRKQGDGTLAERQFRVALDGKDKMDVNMNGPLLNGF
nr:hypothetical protein BaRGS_007681 [Batillaria attramentaria]